MTRNDAVAVVTSYIADVEQALAAQNLERLHQIATERTQLMFGAGALLQGEIEQLIKEMADGPFTRLVESFWLYFKATSVINTVNEILSAAAAHHAAEQAKLIDAAAFGALDEVADKLLDKKKK